jgi:hypothetical protein
MCECESVSDGHVMERHESMMFVSASEFLTSVRE